MLHLLVDSAQALRTTSMQDFLHLSKPLSILLYKFGSNKTYNQ